ncbi:MAG TPA: DUF2723 domain-containing protein [Gemmatimonadaceae bacterium]
MLRLSSRKEIRISLYAGTALAFVLGFIDLWRGGTTVSALLLGIGYCALIPMVIWSGAASDTDSDERPPYGAAAIVSFAILVLYLMTMAPSTAMWDTSEYIAAAYTFGLPHPPGNPFFVIIGRVFSLLPVAGSVAARINVLAAICSAVSAGVWFLIAENALRGWLQQRWLRLAGGTLAALIGATAFTVWNQSVVNEKVYTVSLVGIAIISWLAVRWSERPEGAKADRMLVLIAYLCGLGYANHMAGMLPAPAVALAVLIRRPATVLRWKLLLACLVALVVGVTPFATQPIRAAHFPAMNEGEPTACRTKLELSCTMSKATYDVFMYNFNRGQYGKPDLSERQATFPEQVGMWWLYFRWQWLRDASLQNQFPQSLLAAVFLALGLAGGWVHYKRDRQSFWYFGTLMFTMTLLLIYYLNFKLGSSQNPASDAPHEVRDRDYFFLWSYSAWGVWAALGLVYVWEAIAELVGASRSPEERRASVGPSTRSWLVASPIALLAFVPLVGNWSAASRSKHTSTRNVAADLLNSVEPYGVLVTVGDNDTFPLWYAQEVEGIRRDVVIANTSLLNTDWYARQLIRRPIYDYDEAKGPEIYRGKKWIKPTTSPLHMTFAEADAVPEYYDLRQAMQFNTKNITATIDPKNLQYGVLQRADALVLRMIQDSWPERPIYFARSAVGYPRSLGLENYVLIQGMASKLFVPSATQMSSKDTILIQGDGWFDISRSLDLWTKVFGGPKAIVAEGQWVDRPSVSMPAMYIFAGAELTEALRSHGRVDEAKSVFATARDVAKATNLEEIIRGSEQVLNAPVNNDSATGVQLQVKPSEQPKVQSTEPIGKKKE